MEGSVTPRPTVAVTTDFRNVLATVLRGQGAETAIAGAFPGFKPKFVEGLFRV